MPVPSFQLLILTAPLEPKRAGALVRTLKREGVELYAAFRLGGGRPVRLTARQVQVLRLMAQGHRGPQIAARLRISSKTVETHRRQLMDRIGARSVPELVRYALRSGHLPVSWCFG